MSRCSRSTTSKNITLKQDVFGKTKDQFGQLRDVRRYTWSNSTNNASIQVITYGGTITSIKVPDKNGKIEDVVLGFDTLEEYQSTKNRYYGATIGRVANRTARGKMTIDGVTYTLPVNNGPNHLHGGLVGFDKVIWEDYVTDKKLTLTYHSNDNEEGYPGDLIATVTFELTDDTELIIGYKAVVTKASPVNLTNHSYFNLAGHGAGEKELYKHVVIINADKITEVDSDSTPTGKLPSVSGTSFDLRVPKTLGDVINDVPNSPGFDHNFCVTKSQGQRFGFVAEVLHPESGRVLSLYSNQSGVQFYTGNFLPVDNASQGKGATYRKHGAFCLETQIYPDAVNHEHFPKVVFYPGEEYHQITVFKFSILQ